MKKINLKIGGMSCSACSNGLEKYLNKQTGVISASVNLVMANALIEYDESVLNRKKIEKFVKEAGKEQLTKNVKIMVCHNDSFGGNPYVYLHGLNDRPAGNPVSCNAHP